jgi:hypothetical protein
MKISHTALAGRDARGIRILISGRAVRAQMAPNMMLNTHASGESVTSCLLHAVQQSLVDSEYDGRAGSQAAQLRAETAKEDGGPFTLHETAEALER